MKKQLIKIVSLSMSLMLFSMPLMACGKKESESVSYETWWTSESSEESSEEITTTTTETTEAPTSETEDPTIIENPFTGLIEMDAENAGKRGIGITINNCKVANPQRGTSEASVIFEYETEGGQTRLLCMYPDVSKVPLVGAVRSGRVGSADMCAGTGAIFVCWGADYTAVPSHVKNNNITWLDTNNYIYDSLRGHDAEEVPEKCYCWRDREWMNEPGHRTGIEHCGVTRGDFILRAFDKLGIDTNGEMPRMFNFVESGTANMKDAKSCSEINVYMSSTNDDALFVYNEAEKVYYKSQYNGDPQMDCNVDKQISFTNVFALYCPINLRPGESGGERHKDIHMEEGGKGYYVSYGKLEEITWTKPTPNDPIKCFDKDGKEIEVNAGKSYICIVDTDFFEKTTYKD
ncbi:MAG: DUF3048 C-terminal domain-containing protein [Clostridiales bacterium]|nr:DUF3048 C-terminal domain-containing protein [Clostridiales bacterium]MBR5041406.1 DUF3048 C-terminal domain-containing protein [Clostridiales bacterium]MBR5058845.1 DUF3048 C-terminal domain-containing protein [Clostridiales bacterium]